MLPWPLGTLPPSGSMHRWFPALVTGPPISILADEEVSLDWLAERLREFVDASPEYGAAIGRLASWLARLDDEG